MIRYLKMRINKIDHKTKTNTPSTKIFCNLSLKDRLNRKQKKKSAIPIILEMKLVSGFKLITPRIIIMFVYIIIFVYII